MTSAPLQSASIPFQQPERALSGLDAAIVGQLVTASTDLALVIDRDGVIRDLSVGAPDLAARGVPDWIGRPWIETVTPESRAKVEEVLRDASAGVAGRWREMNHPDGERDTLPVRYFAVAVGDDGRVLVIGRDLQATAALQQKLLHVQQSVERDYLRLRQAESRYRLLFQGAAEAVLILDAGTRKVREVNPAAARLLGRGEDALQGQPLAALIGRDSLDAAQGVLAGAGGTSSAAPVDVILANGVEARMSASLFRQERSSCLLVRLAAPTRADEGDADRLAQVLEGIPDAFVVTGPDLRILAVNPAFLDLTHLASREAAIGQPLDRFVGRPQIDLKVLMAQLREHGSVRNFATVLRGRFGEMEEVEVSAVLAPGEAAAYGFAIRGVARRLPAVSSDDDLLPAARSVSQLTQMIGRAPMKEIVRESTDVIERLCIEAALKMTSNNRAAAADMLGLSRQSLYSKLNRFGLGGGDERE